MIPIRDENPVIRMPLATLGLLVLMGATWVLAQGAGFDARVLARSVCNLGMIAGELTGLAQVGTAVPMGRDMACLVDHDAINVLTPLTSMFLHGGWGHILGNGLFLWVFGKAIEDSMGRSRFLTFYLLCGFAAAVAQAAVNPASPVPMVGASGAISGVMGAYLVLYPRVRVHILFIFVIFLRVLRIPAWAVLLWWIGFQILEGLPEITGTSEGGGSGMAVWAHIGGFAAGLALVKIFEDPDLIRARTGMQRRMAG